MSRPVFVQLLGAPGAGKTAWKRANAERLPGPVFDPFGLAGGIGAWTSDEAIQRACAIREGEVAALVEAGERFALEQDCPAQASRFRAAGYRVEGIYLGTEDPEINVQRIERRVLTRTGRPVDPDLVRSQWRESLDRLAAAAWQFDNLELLDNSADDPPGRPRPVEQCGLERGRVVSRLDPGDMAEWCAGWLADRAQITER